MEKYQAIGLMSGTSLDGLDIAYCIFTYDKQAWSFSIEKAETIPYPEEWKLLLSTLHKSGDEANRNASTELGRLFGKHVSGFIQKHELKVDFIASHGHTILHQPSKGITLQIGDGNEIVAASGLTVINDFRSQDVLMGGQGAPLVPVGDRLLFSDYDYCMNIGGIANISYEHDGRRLAFDICPANMVLNHLAGRRGHTYDNKGSMARKGKILPDLLNKLESLPYYRENGPKSLGKEWVECNIFPLLEAYPESATNDLLHTFCEHMALRVADILEKKQSMLLSGGGAYNTYLVERIEQLSDVRLVLPKREIIEYKEALIFAFLGLLRLKGINNVLSSVTGASKDHCAGIISEASSKR